MRRAILAVTTGCLLLTGAACGSDPKTSTTTAAATPSAAPPSVASSPTADYTADTKAVCTKVNKIFSDDLEDFATDLGKMIANKEAKQTSGADAAEKAAGKDLKDVAAAMKKATAEAEDPALVRAGEQSAEKITATAADGKFYDKIKTTKDVDTVLKAEFTRWYTPLSEFCGG